jgi:predicted negative regulator of RcsB-dependent stress response
VDRLTRKNLKTDKFAEEVEHTVEFVGSHRRQVIMYAGIGLAVVLAAVGIYYYMDYQHGVRQAALRDALTIAAAPVGPARTPDAKSYSTKADKDKALDKAFTEIAAKYNGSEEGSYAEYMLGNLAMDQGRTADAEKRYRSVIDNGSANYASVAKLSLATIYSSQGKTKEAEQLLRSLIEKPTTLVSKEAASIELARILAEKNPDEARKLLTPITAMTDRGSVYRTALTAVGQLPPPTSVAPPAKK